MIDYGKINIGVLALQGDFERHLHQIALLGAKPLQVKLPRDLEQTHALIIPGGESTTMNILIDRFDLRSPLLAFGRTCPIYGTCAGMIMLSRNIINNKSGVVPLGLIDIDVDRNGYGRQIYSFEDVLKVDLGEGMRNLKVDFIRAPKVVRVGKGVKVVAEHRGLPVMVASGRILASSFHAELEDDITLLKYFADNFL
ncbi:MAG: pyridoxal 5'-phosphate synthase glutaminase subunit PdxT [Candidatus Zixiibacteriota bacterium]